MNQNNSMRWPMFADLDLNPHQQRALSRGHRPIGLFVEEYQRYRRLGWTHREIAHELGYRNKKTVSCLVSRARAAGLLPRPAAVALLAMPDFLAHPNGLVLCAGVLLAAVGTFALLARSPRPAQTPTAADNRRALAEDTARQADAQAHNTTRGDLG